MPIDVRAIRDMMGFGVSFEVAFSTLNNGELPENAQALYETQKNEIEDDQHFDCHNVNYNNLNDDDQLYDAQNEYFNNDDDDEENYETLLQLRRKKRVDDFRMLCDESLSNFLNGEDIDNRPFLCLQEMRDCPSVHNEALSIAINYFSSLLKNSDNRINPQMRFQILFTMLGSIDYALLLNETKNQIASWVVQNLYLLQYGNRQEVKQCLMYYVQLEPLNMERIFNALLVVSPKLTYDESETFINTLLTNSISKKYMLARLAYAAASQATEIFHLDFYSNQIIKLKANELLDVIRLKIEWFNRLYRPQNHLDTSLANHLDTSLAQTLQVYKNETRSRIPPKSVFHELTEINRHMTLPRVQRILSEDTFYYFSQLVTHHNSGVHCKIRAIVWRPLHLIGLFMLGNEETVLNEMMAADDTNRRLYQSRGLMDGIARERHSNLFRQVCHLNRRLNARVDHSNLEHQSSQTPVLNSDQGVAHCHYAQSRFSFYQENGRDALFMSFEQWQKASTNLR